MYIIYKIKLFTIEKKNTNELIEHHEFFFFTKVPTYSINYYKHHTVPIYSIHYIKLYYEHPYVCTILLW